MPTRPRIALRPAGTRGFLADAIRAGGGEVVEPDDAEALVWADPHDPAELPELLSRHPDIVWVQLPWAGIEPMLDIIDTDHVWTCGKGVYAEEVAEHALALALAGFRHLGAYARASEWTQQKGQNLLGARVAILGGGGIATSFIRLLEPFGCHVTVVRRRAEPVPTASATCCLGDLDETLPTCDLLLVALALTPETEGVINRDRLALLPTNAWLVNVARGRHVVTDHLVEALSEKRIGGAALDVTDPEPLPADHPLWGLPNCLITPHTANTPEMALPVLSRRITENVRKFAAGDPLIGLVDRDVGY